MLSRDWEPPIKKRAKFRHWKQDFALTHQRVGEDVYVMPEINPEWKKYNQCVTFEIGPALGEGAYGVVHNAQSADLPLCIKIAENSLEWQNWMIPSLVAGPSAPIWPLLAKGTVKVRMKDGEEEDKDVILMQRAQSTFADFFAQLTSAEERIFHAKLLLWDLFRGLAALEDKNRANLDIKIDNILRLGDYNFICDGSKAMSPADAGAHRRDIKDAISTVARLLDPSLHPLVQYQFPEFGPELATVITRAYKGELSAKEASQNIRELVKPNVGRLQRPVISYIWFWKKVRDRCKQIGSDVVAGEDISFLEDYEMDLDDPGTDSNSQSEVSSSQESEDQDQGAVKVPDTSQNEASSSTQSQDRDQGGFEAPYASQKPPRQKYQPNAPGASQKPLRQKEQPKARDASQKPSRKIYRPQLDTEFLCDIADDDLSDVPPRSVLPRKAKPLVIEDVEHDANENIPPPRINGDAPVDKAPRIDDAQLRVGIRGHLATLPPAAIQAVGLICQSLRGLITAFKLDPDKQAPPLQFSLPCRKLSVLVLDLKKPNPAILEFDASWKRIRQFCVDHSAVDPGFVWKPSRIFFYKPGEESPSNLALILIEEALAICFPGSKPTKTKQQLHLSSGAFNLVVKFSEETSVSTLARNPRN